MSRLIKKILYVGTIFGFFLIFSSCSTFMYEHVSPNLEDLADYDIVYFSLEERQIRFATSDGKISQGYDFNVIVPGIEKNMIGSKSMQMFTWGPNGNYLAFITRYNGPWGVPVLYDINKNEYLKCNISDLPESETRVWVIGGKKIIAVAHRKEEDQIVTLDFETCQMEILYEASDGNGFNESIIEVNQSTNGWLAISRYMSGSIDRFEILIISPNGEEYLIKNAGSPAWSKNGEFLAFAKEDMGIFVTDKTGANISHLIPLEETHVSTQGSDFISWSPDGNYLAHEYLSDIYIYNFDTLSDYLLVENGIYPNWRWD